MAAASSVGASNSALTTPLNTSKVMTAARDFEAVMLNTLLRSLQETYSRLPGESSQSFAGSDDYAYMGTEALSAALARSGGLGLARLIAAKIAPNEGMGQEHGGQEFSCGPSSLKFP